MDPGLVTQVVLIAAISLAATVSAVSGVRRGIRILSEWNIGLSIILLGGFIILGPGMWLMGFVATSFGEYLWHALPMGLWIAISTRWAASEPAGSSSWSGRGTTRPRSTRPSTG